MLNGQSIPLVSSVNHLPTTTPSAFDGFWRLAAGDRSAASAKFLLKQAGDAVVLGCGVGRDQRDREGERGQDLGEEQGAGARGA